MDIKQALDLVRAVRHQVRRKVYGINDGENYHAAVEQAICATTGQVLQLLHQKKAPEGMFTREQFADLVDMVRTQARAVAVAQLVGAEQAETYENSADQVLERVEASLVAGDD